MQMIRDAGVTLYDGMSLAPPKVGEPRVITEPVPFAVFYGSLGYDDRGEHRNGYPSRRSVYWSVIYVGLSRDQALWVGERQREALRGKALIVPGHKSWRVSVESSQVVRRDDDAIRPDGKPLFYGTDEYAASITTRPDQSLISA